MDNQQGTLSIAWIGGLMVGEGWFGFGLKKNGRHTYVAPSFGLRMTDFETMNLVADRFKELGLAFWVNISPKEGERKNVKPCMYIQVEGIKRMKRLLDVFLPVLTGDKKKSAQFVSTFVESRLSLPKNSPYTQDEVAAVNGTREMTGRKRLLRD